MALRGSGRWGLATRTLPPGTQKLVSEAMSETYIHPKALVETDRIGAGTRIWAFAHVMVDVVAPGRTEILATMFLLRTVSVSDGAGSGRFCLAE